MFAMIKALYTDVELKYIAYFNGISTQAFPLYQGSGKRHLFGTFYV